MGYSRRTMSGAETRHDLLEQRFGGRRCRPAAAPGALLLLIGLLAPARRRVFT
jgi:hypothetical protein